ncbi:kinase-like domain-containing protein [Hypoxylon rubiginosum]|uniref:Kinase-like domain-containing protein n=1 Tax=Hypoxylon rubiginosum TaxID=110542 RepID=A0ACB9YI72_9PEZI|nr:kinase-like domain-containing protein [Hypoxylon rubiginosum]
MMSEQETQEDGCFLISFERKYYHCGNTFIKRSLRPREFRTGYRGLHIPRVNKERLKNEAASLRYIRQHTNIPVPAVYCDFEDDEAYYLITEYVEGVGMSELQDKQKEVVRLELEDHLATLRGLTSNQIGGPTGIVIPPYRVMRRTEEDKWILRVSVTNDYVFCHNDLSQQNVIVDPTTLKIKAIIDWEYAGFYPPFFEWPIYNRLGPSSAMEGEADDSSELLSFLNSQVKVSRYLLPSWNQL